MATTYFKYRKHPQPQEDDPYPHAPRIPILLIGNEARIQSTGLLDTGSTVTIIPPDIADILGLETGEKIPIKTINGAIDGHESEIKIEVPLQRNPVRVRVPCQVVDFDEIILGRTVFFNPFEITFYEQQGKVRLKDIRSKLNKMKGL